jgi:hypothetical protein
MPLFGSVIFEDLARLGKPRAAILSIDVQRAGKVSLPGANPIAAESGPISDL